MCCRLNLVCKEHSATLTLTSIGRIIGLTCGSMNDHMKGVRKMYFFRRKERKKERNKEKKKERKKQRKKQRKKE